MKKIGILLIVIVYTTTLFSQETNKEADIHSRNRPGIGWFYSGFKPLENGDINKYDRLMIDVVYNDWYGDQDYFESPWNSIGFNASMMFDIALTRSNTVALGVGAGYSYFNNKSKLQFNRNFDNNTTTATKYLPKDEPTKNKFGANYIEIPLELRFRTKGIQHFKFYVGGKIGYAINAFTKEVDKINSKKYSTKEVNFPDLNRWRYGVTARIGIRNFAIYAAYYFSPLFKSDESTQLYPISMGITFSLL